MNRLAGALEALRLSGLDGWLLYDFRGSNPLLWQLLGVSLHSTRRVFLLLRPSGRAVLLVHQVDVGHFPTDGIDLRPYQNREDLLAQLEGLLRPGERIAMEYSPLGALPTLSYVDGGTLELVRSFGVTVESSADLAQVALCRLTTPELASHRQAAQALGEVVQAAFRFIGAGAGRGVTEYDTAEFIRSQFAAAGFETDSGPVVAVNRHAGDPHYEPKPAASSAIEPGDWVLIDLWAKQPSGIYGDITWVGYLGDRPPAAHTEVFHLVAGARDAAVEFIERQVRAGEFPPGWEVDAVARRHIEAAGYGPRFTHRLGHSLGHVVHGYGANLDGYETLDTRRLAPGLAFTIEPGIYLPEFGVRCEIDLYMTEQGPEITSPVQREIVLIEVE